MMRNMRSESTLKALAEAPVGVLGFTAKDLTPRAIAVTPYVIAGEPTVTTTLALLAKVKMLRNRPEAAMFAGGVHLSGRTSIVMHAGTDWFDENLRELEPEKYPPAKSLLSIPFHRRLLWWYLGRAVITFDDATVTSIEASDKVTLTSVVDGKVVITPLPPGLVTDGDEISMGVDVPDGPGCLVVHHETDAMAELLSLTLRGNVTNRLLRVEFRKGGLQPQEPGAIAQLNSLRALGRAAKANRSTIESWNRPREEETTS